MIGRSLRGGNYKMCQLCKTKPVYEFINQRQVCKNCFIRWFEKKVLYTIRKFEMIKRGDIIGYEEKKYYRRVVLKKVLEIISKKGFVEIAKLPAKKKITKIALPSTTDTESEKIIHELISGNAKNFKSVKAVEGKNIKPLYLFLDKEVLLYAKLKNLKFSKPKKERKDKISSFVDELEKKHPEIKWAIVKGFLEVRN